MQATAVTFRFAHGRGLGDTVTGNTFVIAWTAPANAAFAPVATYALEAGTVAGATPVRPVPPR